MAIANCTLKRELYLQLGKLHPSAPNCTTSLNSSSFLVSSFFDQMNQIAKLKIAYYHLKYDLI